MKQIVFLIGAFVVLLQLHSTTATDDSQADWDEVNSNVRLYTDTMKHRLEKLKEVVESTWKEAKVEVPAKWTKFIVPYIEYMDTVKEGFSEYIGELRKTASLKWKEIEPKIVELVDGLTLKLEEIAKRIADGASGTRQDIDDSVSWAIEELTKLMETKPGDTMNILKEAIQKKLNAKQTADGQESQKNE